MTNVKLVTAPLEFEGRTYNICCNMNVLADVQEEFGGEMPLTISGKKGIRVLLAFLAAMLNDAADSAGWPERFTGKEIGRKLGASELNEVRRVVMPLVIASAGGGEAPSPAEASMNGENEEDGEARPT